MSDEANTLSVEQEPFPGKRMLIPSGAPLVINLRLSQPAEGAAYLRTNLGSADIRRREIIAAVEENRPRLETDWKDLPMERLGPQTYRFSTTLHEVGIFEAKSFFMAENGTLYWPPGENIVIKVEPASAAAANTVYTAFIRQFGSNKNNDALSPAEAAQADALEEKGCTVIPRSGTFRDLTKELDLIICDMGFRIIHLLPIHPVPTTFARMGRFGSPFAALDFMDVDRSLAQFDRRTTPLEQFMELVQEIHARDACVYLDVAMNHTGWASHLQVHHPEWFPRETDGSFRSPGAWGVVWEDLSELDYSYKSLWQYMAEVFLFWCEKGVDGFRCDAGYMVPFRVWEYIAAKVRQVYPQTVFLLEGLGGKLSTTEQLLGDAGLNWAYSELFQNYTRDQAEQFLPLCFRLESTRGLLVQFAETHDNERLAKTSKRFSRLRTALCALCSEAGTFGIANGVEWYADKKVDVHGAPSLNWGAEDNQISWLRRLTTVISYHPAFQMGSERHLVNSGDGNAIALFRKGAHDKHHVLILANLSSDTQETVEWQEDSGLPGTMELYDLLTEQPIQVEKHNQLCRLDLQAGEVRCLSEENWDCREYEQSPGFSEALDFWRFRAKYAELLNAYSPGKKLLPGIPPEKIREFMEKPFSVLQSMNEKTAPSFVKYIVPEDLKRRVMVPPGMALAVAGPEPFMLLERSSDGVAKYTDRSLRSSDGQHFVVIPPGKPPSVSEERKLELRMFVPVTEGPDIKHGSIIRLCRCEDARVRYLRGGDEIVDGNLCALSANWRASVSYVRALWPQIKSQYDCIFGLNPQSLFPADRLILWTRCRCWVVYKDYSREVNAQNLRSFLAKPGRNTVWRFTLPLGEGYTVPFRIELTLEKETNRVTVSFCREESSAAENHPVLQSDETITVIVRPDIENRDFHSKTKAFTGPEEEFPASLTTTDKGFRFCPGNEQFILESDQGKYVHEPEWQYMTGHPLEAERGLDDSSDLFSPGYFANDLKTGERLDLTGGSPASEEEHDRAGPQENNTGQWLPRELIHEPDAEQCGIREAAQLAIKDFIVRRNSSFTVLAGYPWFLDWGRDTLICLRGIISTGWHELALSILTEFARFEKDGTLPNMIHGDNASNRDTSDAPLWFIIACRDLINAGGRSEILDTDCGGRSIRAVLGSIAENYSKGTPNGIKMDKDSGLIYSPEHFTWMDTQYPAGTPRAGYPVEIQALWSAALKFLCQISSGNDYDYQGLHAAVDDAIQRFYVRADGQGLADCLHAKSPSCRAADSVADDHCRPNQLLALTLADILPEQIQRQVVNSCWKLLVPGAIRTLADIKVDYELPLYSADGTLLNDPQRPYRGYYGGDEDTSRKPAYHNGTAWTWLFPSFCEALAKAYGQQVRNMALDLLGSTAELFNDGCVGHLPEILDGDAPHRQKGCGAQAWAATEVARVAALLSEDDRSTYGYHFPSEK